MSKKKIIIISSVVFLFVLVLFLLDLNVWTKYFKNKPEISEQQETTLTEEQKMKALEEINNRGSDVNFTEEQKMKALEEINNRN
jgi:uncharacterized membrane protein YvbJ